MNTVLATLAISIVLGADPAPQPVTWEANYGVALAAARDTNRSLLVVIESPAQPKNPIEQVGFSKETVQDELLSPYILCRVDASTEYGKKVAAAFGTTEFPFTAITNKGATKLVYKNTGEISAEKWASTLVTYKNVTLAPAYYPATARRAAICFT